jgi:tight adherence protein B
MEAPWVITISTFTFAAVFLFGCAWPAMVEMFRRQEQRYDRVLVHHLLIDINPRTAVWLSIVVIAVCGLIGFMVGSSIIIAVIGAAFGFLLPHLTIKHLEQKRYERLEAQLVDGITTLSAGVRAGLTLVQAMELLARNLTGPIRQEFGQLLREYQMGLDLNQAMRNSAARIGSPHYRLLFTAIEMHRQRGGDTGESLDRIAESIRELQRLEGKLDALTSQGRFQAWAMAIMPVVFLGLLYMIDRQGVELLFTQPLGRMLMLVAVLLIATGVVWIRRIMAVEL